jgi:hypothetical protein
MPRDQDLTNADLAPTLAADRTWNLWHIASLWVGMSVCIPSYMPRLEHDQRGARLALEPLCRVPRQPHRARPARHQRACGHAVRHPLSGVRARGVRHSRHARPRRAARDRGLWLVRHPGLDRRPCHPRARRHPVAWLPGDGRRLEIHGLRRGTLPELRGVLAHEPVLRLGRHRGREVARDACRAGVAAAWLCAAGMGGVRGGWVRGAARRRRPARRGPDVAFALRPRPVGHGNARLLGHALAEHPRLHPLCAEPARSDGRPGARAADDDAAGGVDRGLR